MSAIEALKARLRAGDHEGALPLIEQLLATRPDQAPLHWHHATCLAALERPDDALEAVGRVLALKPDYAPAWLKRAELCLMLRGEYPAFEFDVREAIALDPAFARAHRVLAEWLYVADSIDEATAMLNKAIELEPRDAEALAMRASWAETAAWTVEPGEDSVPQHLGMTLSRPKLERALADYEAAIALDDSQTHWKVKRARLLHQLQRFDEALVAYDLVLVDLPTGDPQRELIEDMRQRSEGQGAGEREASARLLESSLDQFSDKEKARTDFDTVAAMVRSASQSVRHGVSLEQALEQFTSDDPKTMQAVNIAYSIHRVGNEAEPDYQPADASEFSDDQRRFADAAAADLQAQGFHVLGDFNPVHLQETLSRPTLVRLYRDAQGTIMGASFKLMPKRPGWLPYLLMRMTGQWKQPAVVDLETGFDDGRFLVTNNAGDTSPFRFGPVVHTESLPLKSDVLTVIARHEQRVADYRAAHPTVTPLVVHDLDAVIRLQRLLTMTKNAYRRSIGYVDDHELRQLLGRRYDDMADEVREKLAILIAMDEPDAPVTTSE